jgi:hypothetical protein
VVRIATTPASPEEISAYGRDGVVSPTQFRIPDASLERLRTAARSIIAENAITELVLVAHVPDRPGVAGGIEHGEAMFKVAIDPMLLDLVEQLIGPNIVLWGSSIFTKPARVGQAVQWHQEANYWRMKPLVTVSTWIAIDPATVDNGCLRFLPGSHRRGLLRHTEGADSSGVLRVRIAPEEIDESTSVSVPAAPGAVVALDSWVVHGSNANLSAAARAAFTIRYMPATSHFDRSHRDDGAYGANPEAVWTSRPIWLVRGENRHPGNDFAVGHERLADLDVWAEQGRRDWLAKLG